MKEVGFILKMSFEISIWKLGSFFLPSLFHSYFVCNLLVIDAFKVAFAFHKYVKQ